MTLNCTCDTLCELIFDIILNPGNDGAAKAKGEGEDGQAKRGRGRIDKGYFLISNVV